MSTGPEVTAAAAYQDILFGSVLIEYRCAVYKQDARYGHNPVGNMAAMFVFY